MFCYLGEKNERKTKDEIFTRDTDTVKGETHSNNRGLNDRSKIQIKVASNRPGPKHDQRVGSKVADVVVVVVVVVAAAAVVVVA